MIFPKIIGHRGAPHIAPENTMASFQAAIELGVDGIETDVQLTNDGCLIICHDETLDRTTNGKGFLKDFNLKEIKNLSAGEWFSPDYKDEKIPTLKDFFDLVHNKNLLINIEIKSGIVFYPGIEQKVIQMIYQYNIKDRVILSSFNHYSLLECKKIDSSIKTGALYMEGLVNPWEYAAKIGADALHPLFYNIRPEIMKGIKENKIMVNTFTVNHEEQMKYIIGLEVDGIITDYPDKLLRIKKEMKDNNEA